MEHGLWGGGRRGRGAAGTRRRRGNGSEFGRGLSPRPPVRSLGCFPCLHSKRRLAKKIRTSVAAGGAHPPGPDRLFWHITGWRAARTVRLVQNFFASRLMLCRHGKQPGERRRKRPRLTSSPASSLPRPHLALSQATPTPSLIPSFASYIFHLLSLSRIPTPNATATAAVCSFHPSSPLPYLEISLA